MQQPSVSLCFPCYNEERGIQSVLQEAHDLMIQSGYPFEILVCNDGSQDQTGSRIESLRTKLPNLVVLHHEKNWGIQPTFEHLYSKAKSDFVFLNSTDRQWDTAIVLDLLKLTEHFDIIVTRRLNKPYKLFRRVVSASFNFLPALVFGVKTFDAGSVKLVKREVFERISILSRSPFAEAERLIRAARLGYRITHFPVFVRERKEGKASGARISLVLMSMVDLFRCFWDIRLKAVLSVFAFLRRRSRSATEISHH